MSISGITVVFKNFLPVTMGFVAYMILVLAGKTEEGDVALFAAIVLQILYLCLRYAPAIIRALKGE